MDRTYDLVVLGAGAAGMGAAQYGARANLKTLIIEEMAPGGQALLIDRLENYPGLPEPVDGYSWAATMSAQAESFGAETMTTSVESVRKNGDLFVIETSDGPIEARAVVAATGAKHRHLGVKG
ncbi:MAG: FAD-dependent oxidoreductase, partial [Spirochaetales bacterium]|nr:FAD-dependent oxidoreductase [Spirochaetales bacterium]